MQANKLVFEASEEITSIEYDDVYVQFDPT